MARNVAPRDLVDPILKVGQGDALAALDLMRRVRKDELTLADEILVVDGIYQHRTAFRSRRLQFALALMCARTGARTRARAILLELVGVEYPPALHHLGCDLIEAGRHAAGAQLLRLARESGYRLGDVAYWRYQARVVQGPPRPWPNLRVFAARLMPMLRTDPASEDLVPFWLPE